MKETKHTADYVAAGCAIYTADDWRDGNNHGGKIVASTALNLIDADHEDDMPENAETDFAETIVNALNTAPSLLAENARLREWLEQLKQTATSVLSYSKESAEPLRAVLVADSNMRDNKLRKALSSILNELEQRPGNLTGYIAQAQSIESKARLALAEGSAR